MKNLLIGFPDEPTHYLRNLYRALKLLNTPQEKTKIRFYPHGKHPINFYMAEAEEINRRYNAVTIFVGDSIPKSRLKELMVLTTYLNKPFCIIFEELAAPNSPSEKEMIGAICHKARYIYTVQNSTRDTLSHHYQIEAERITPLHYGYWPAIESQPNQDVQHRMSLYADHKTICNLELLIRVIPKLKKADPLLKVDIHTNVPLLQSNHWIIRNKFLINRLNLTKEVTWHTMKNQSISDWAINHDLSVFAWEDGHGGNQSLRFEVMAAGGAVVCLNDAFAQDQLTDQRAFLIGQDDTDFVAELLSAWYVDQKGQKILKEIAGLAGETQTWLTVAQKIKEKLFVLQQMEPQFAAPQFNLSLSSPCKPIYNKLLNDCLLKSDLSFSSLSLWMLKNLKYNPRRSAIDLFYVRFEHTPISKIQMNSESLFEMAHAMAQLAKLNIPQMNNISLMALEKIAPMVQEDYLLIELLYHVTLHRNKPTPNLSTKIKEHSQFIAQAVDTVMENQTVNNKLNLVKTIATLFEAAELIRDNLLFSQAESLFQSLENEIFVSGSYKPIAHISSDEIMPFSYWISCCMESLGRSKGYEAPLLRMEQIVAWFFGFNDKNKIYLDSNTGLCEIQLDGDRGGYSSQQTIRDTIYFWLIQDIYQSAIIRTYHQASK